MLPNYYAILGIPPTASLDDIRRAYRKAAFATHPDRGGSNHLMQRINEAYETLGNPDKRRAYDLHRGNSDRQPAAKRTPPAKRRPAPRSPTFARIAGSLLGRALNTINHWISPAAPKKRRPAATRITIIPCSYCGQKLRVKPGAAKIRCPKCRRWDVLG